MNKKEVPMATYTTEQMRALARRGPGPDEAGPWEADVRAALRAAADEREARTDAERLAEVLFDADYGNGAWWDHTGDAVDSYHQRARYVIERLAELAEADRV